MKIVYYEEDDILFLELAKGEIVRDESASWNVNIGYTADGIGEITILDAQKSGIYPLQIERVAADAVWYVARSSRTEPRARHIDSDPFPLGHRDRGHLPRGDRQLVVSKVAGHNSGMRHPNLSLILGELSTELQALYRERFDGLWLYGSQARGDASPESDIDVLLILTRMDRPALEIDRYAGILADLNLRHGVLLSVMPVAQSQRGTIQLELA